MKYPLADLSRYYTNIFSGKRVFVTGHTGFKGSWLCEWLLECGAHIRGYALAPETKPNLFTQLGLEDRLEHVVADVREADQLRKAILDYRPDYVFHLAAQPLVMASYKDPRQTFETNVIGTLNLLEALRDLQSPCIGILVTSDKCYRNDNAGHAFKETDPLGGSDPYSASKGAMEIVVHAYRKSFFADSRILLATVRAGNVIGGGDFSTDRIIPDCIRCLSDGLPIRVRNPAHTRPWQHVLEPLSGYLWLASKMAGGWTDPDDLYAFNFGPAEDGHRSVEDLVNAVLETWPGTWESPRMAVAPSESQKLALSVEKAQAQLTWEPRWPFAETVKQTVSWYQAAKDIEPGDRSSFINLTHETIRNFARSDA